MATLRQASRTDMTGWERVPERGDGEVKIPSVPDESNTPGRSPDMLAAMPPQATTGDGLQRQFYGGANLPVHRTLPIRTGL